jgi:hypothetical protein
MAESNRNRDPRPLADALRREAAAERPEFSRSLHARLCEAVRQARAPSPASSPSHPSHPSHLSYFSFAFAAAIALLLVSAAVWLRPKDSSTEVQTAEAKLPLTAPADAAADLDQATALAGQAIDGLDDLVDQAMASQQWGGLDEDARAVWDALAEELPADISSALAFSEPSAGTNP